MASPPPAFADPVRVCGAAHDVLLGAALGMAVGLQTDGGQRAAIARRYPEGAAIGLPCATTHQGAPPPDWAATGGFTAVVCALRALRGYYAGDETSAVSAFAKMMAGHRQGPGWTSGGADEDAGAADGGADEDAGAADGGATVGVWKQDSGCEAMLRGLACAFTRVPAEWAVAFAVGPGLGGREPEDMGAAAAAALALLLSQLAQVPLSGAVRPDVVAWEGIEAGRAVLLRGRSGPQADLRVSEYARALAETWRVGDLRLGEHDSRPRALKALACAVWAVRGLARTPIEARTADAFKSAVREVAMEGGSAGVYCAVVGAVLGAAACELPEDWCLALPHRDALLRELEEFLEAAVGSWPVAAQ